MASTKPKRKRTRAATRIKPETLRTPEVRDWTQAESPFERYHKFPWPTADVGERRRLAAELLYASLTTGELRTAVDQCLEQFVDLYLRGVLFPETIARNGAALALGLGGAWRKRSDIESATYLAFAAVDRMHLDTARERPVPKIAIKRFREAAQRLAKVDPFKGRKKLAYARLITCAGNLCDGTREGFRLFVQFVIESVFGNIMGTLPLREAERVTGTLFDRGVEYEGENLTGISLKNASEAARRKVLNATLHALGVTPPRSGARRDA